MRPPTKRNAGAAPGGFGKATASKVDSTATEDRPRGSRFAEVLRAVMNLTPAERRALCRAIMPSELPWLVVTRGSRRIVGRFRTEREALEERDSAYRHGVDTAVEQEAQ